MASPKFYVASPNGDRTGGPECLHQLVDAIRRRGVEAHIIPMYNFRGRRPDPEYDVYDYDVVENMPRCGSSAFTTHRTPARATSAAVAVAA